MGDTELGDKVVEMVRSQVARETATLNRKLRTRTAQRDQWAGHARAYRTDLLAALRKVAELEAEVKRLLQETKP